MTIQGAEAQVFRLAWRAHQQRIAASRQVLAADLAVLGLTGSLDLDRCHDTPDGGISLAFVQQPQEAAPE